MTSEQRMERLKDLARIFKAAQTDRAKLDAGNAITAHLAEDFETEAKAIVGLIESDQFPTTRGSYGRYMAIINEFQGFYRLGMIRALKNAGAGQGLDDAVRVS